MTTKRQARRLAAILAADMVGFSRLVELNEAGTLGKQRAIMTDLVNPLVAEYHGRIVKTTGDGFLAEFSSALHAAECAIAFQRYLTAWTARETEGPKLTYRIGIDLGDIVTDGDDIFGEGVNIASRLESIADPGGICISANVFEQVRNKLPGAFEPMGPQKVKNISLPVSTYRLSPYGSHGFNVPRSFKREPERGRVGKLVAVSAACAVALLIGLMLWHQDRQANELADTGPSAYQLPDKPSIAVLPFENLSDDVKQGYLADGITDDLISDLSSIQELFVIARGTSFSYKGKKIAPKAAAEELGVRYVLEGSVRRVAETVRINWYLVDTATGGQIWAKRLDGDFARVLLMQEEATGELFAALNVATEPPASDEGDTVTETNPEAYDLFLRGLEQYRLDAPQKYKLALGFFERALEIDPSYDRARSAMASIYWRAYIGEWAVVLGLGPTVARRRAEELLNEVRREDVALAEQVRSQILLWRGKHDEAIAAAERAVSLSDSDTDTWIILAEALIYGGRPAEALEIIRREQRRDPNSPSRYAFVEGLAYYVQENFSAAARSFERSLALNPDLWNPEGKLGRPYCYPCVALISTYGHLDRAGDAKPHLEAAIYHQPTFSIASELFLWPFKQGPDLERFRVGLIKAGVSQLQ
ncbi:adenylate/guanylate cyclase domain-containing protein [Limibaculum sp. FT325]|uniref:adenylate/guanylate cyclase domain-containing protein n=1 Tax=Thermohalobaculum sediminis TaxID=2939436 RepID=UPI0020C0E9B1|nr:adenylate/guanylate cyclase domain-containing protein [Limibaculum sediminis]MCL5779299.1 adenylate/guanylate cyclase domain-containing protein [Limibaculum sediminis]